MPRQSRAMFLAEIPELVDAELASLDTPSADWLARGARAERADDFDDADAFGFRSMLDAPEACERAWRSTAVRR